MERARAFADAGADCVFPIIFRDAVGLANSASGSAHRNTFGRPGGPSVAEFGATAPQGQFPPGPQGAALARSPHGRGSPGGGAPNADMAFRPPTR